MLDVDEQEVTPSLIAVLLIRTETVSYLASGI